VPISHHSPFGSERRRMRNSSRITMLPRSRAVSMFGRLNKGSASCRSGFRSVLRRRGTSCRAGQGSPFRRIGDYSRPRTDRIVPVPPTHVLLRSPPRWRVRPQSSYRFSPRQKFLNGVAHRVLDALVAEPPAASVLSLRVERQRLPWSSCLSSCPLGSLVHSALSSFRGGCPGRVHFFG
jgi:hypothetical protein